MLRKLETKKSSSDDELPPYEGKWRHYNQLVFLKDTFVRRDLVPKTIYVSDEEDSNTTLEHSIFYELSKSPPKKEKDPPPVLVQRKRKRDSHSAASQDSVEHKILKTESKILGYLEKSDDDDLMFLKSLLPYFKQMDPVQKLRIRSLFQNIIIEEISSTE